MIRMCVYTCVCVCIYIYICILLLLLLLLLLLSLASSSRQGQKHGGLLPAEVARGARGTICYIMSQYIIVQYVML